MVRKATSSYSIYGTQFVEDYVNVPRKLFIVNCPAGLCGFVSSLMHGDTSFLKLTGRELDEVYSFFDDGNFEERFGYTDEGKIAILNLYQMPPCIDHKLQTEAAERISIALSNSGPAST